MPGPTPTNLDIAAYAHQEAVTYAAWLRAGNSTGDLSEHAVEGLEKHFVHVIRHALSVRLGDLADNPPAQTQIKGDDWFSQVVSFFVKQDMLDAREEYDISDVMTALADNYEPAPKAIDALRKLEAAAFGGYLTPSLCADIVTSALATAPEASE